MPPEPLKTSIDLAFAGDRLAQAQLLGLVQEELRGLAGRILKAKGPGLSLGATDLVQEACLRLIGDQEIEPKGRNHLIATAGLAMRQIVASYARGKFADKRGGGWKRVTLSGVDSGKSSEVDLVALDDALNLLAEIDPRQSRLVELRFFGRLSIAECSEVMGDSTATLERAWRGAKAWLGRELRRERA